MLILAWIRSWLGKLLLEFLWGKLYSFIKESIKRRNQEREIKKIEKVEDEISEANKIADQKERLKKKSELACEMEKAIDPNHNC